MDAIIALLPTAEVFIVCLGLFVWLRRQPAPYPVASALALGITSGLMLLSFLLQIGFLAQRPELIPLLETASLGGIVWLNWGKWQTVVDIRQWTVAAWGEYPRILTVLTVALFYLWLQAMLLPPSSWDSLVYHLPRVLLWQQNRSLFLPGFTTAPQVAFPVGSDILFHLFLRFRLDYGLGLFSWLSYSVILLGTYALARPRVSQTVALASAIAIICLPEIVYQSTGTKNDIIVAAIALTCVVWADRWLQVASIESLAGLGLTLCFGVAAKTSFVLFAAFFLPLWLSLVVQRGKLSILVRSLVDEWRTVALCLVPGIILSQSWLFIYNYRQFGNWLGPEDFIVRNQNNEGLLGGTANLVRYSFQSIHLLQPVNWLWQSLTGGSIIATLQSVYDSVFAPLFGNAGQAEFIKWQPLEIEWQPQEDTSWFGPVSVFLVFPSVGWCLVKGRQLSRILAILTICLALAISYKVGWSPWKSRFFTLVFVCTGLCVATFLQQSRLKEIGLSGWRWLSMAILVYACLYNYAKPMIPLPKSQSYENISRENIWLRSHWTRNRQVYDQLYHGTQTESIHQALAAAKRVAIIGYDHYFSILLQNPDIEFVFLQTEDRYAETHPLVKAAEQLAAVDHLICFQKPCVSATEAVSLDLVWESPREAHVPQVYRVLAQNQTGSH